MPARSVARFTTLASPLITLLIAATLQAGCDIVIALAAALAMSREPTREGSVAEVGRAAAFDLALVAPALPPFRCPDGLTEMDYLRRLVAAGARRRYGERPAAHEDLSLRARAWTTLDHELAIIASAVVIVAITWDAPNQVGTWTFLLLWAMRQSAKLNFFLGVLNLSEEFLPKHLAYLRSFLARKPMNLLLPISVTAGTVLLTVLLGAPARCAAAGSCRAGPHGGRREGYWAVPHMVGLPAAVQGGHRPVSVPVAARGATRPRAAGQGQRGEECGREPRHP